MSAYSLILLLVGAMIGWLLATCFWGLYLLRNRATEAGRAPGGRIVDA